MNWHNFDRRTDALGHALRARGIGVGDRVAVLCHDCIETAEIFIACAKIGAIRIGLNPRLAPPELRMLVADCTPGVILVEAGCAALLPDGPDLPPKLGFAARLGNDTEYEVAIARFLAAGPLAHTPGRSHHDRLHHRLHRAAEGRHLPSWPAAQRHPGDRPL